MSMWAWLVLGLGVSILVYALFVIALLIAGRREGARALAGLHPRLRRSLRPSAP
jgi:hypothetical protein